MGAPLPFNVPAMIAYQGRLRAEQPALIVGNGSGEETLSYGELERRVCQWANHFSALGLQPGDRIGLCLNDTAEQVIALLAALRAQLPFLAMDWKSARAEVEQRAERLDLKLVLCHSDRNRPAEVGQLCDEAWRAAVARAPCEYPLPSVAPDTTALLAASSGTTGTPAVVRLTHGALFARTLSGSWLPHSPDRDDRVLRALPLANTLGRGFNFSYFCSGCPSVLLPSLHGPEEYLGAIVRHRITHANANPTILRGLVERAAAKGPLLPGLRVLICTGSNLDRELKQEVLGRVTPNLFEKYGAVATGVMASTRPGDAQARPDSVGRLEFGVTLEAVDETDRPLPPGQVGVLRCKSPQAALPLDSGESDGEARPAAWRDGYWYTEDHGSLDEDGYLTLAGRSASLIIRASVNIYAEELEAVIAGHPEVREVAVCGRPVPALGEEPVALVVARDPAVLDTAVLLAHCRQRLAGNKCPAEIFLVKELPRAAAGKIERAALPELLRLMARKASSDRASGRGAA